MMQASHVVRRRRRRRGGRCRLRQEEGQAARRPTWRRPTSSGRPAVEVRDQGRHVVGAIREGRAAMHAREDELKARRDARVETARRPARARRSALRRRPAGRLGASDRPQAQAVTSTGARRRPASGARSARGSATVPPSSRCTGVTPRTWRARRPVVCLPETTAEVQACVRIAARHGVPFVAAWFGNRPRRRGGAARRRGGHRHVEDGRGASASTRESPGMGPARRAQPRPHPPARAPSGCTSPPIRAASRRARSAATSPTTRAVRTAWPRASPPRTCSPSRSCSPTARSPCSAARTPSRAGYDLRGVFVGSEGMLGIATAVCVKLTQNPPAVRTLLMDFDTVDDGAATVSGIIAAGMVPAAVEMMDQLCLQAVEAYIHAGLPVDAAAALLVEVVGLRARRRSRRRRASSRSPVGIGSARCASPRTTPSGRCSGRVASRRSVRSPGSSPTTTCTTPSCRAASCPRCSTEVYEIAARHDLQVLNVFHAGDGNLHPLLVYDAREPGVRRARPSGRRRDRACLGRGRRGAERRARDRSREARLHAADVLRGRSRRPGRAPRAPSTRIGAPTPARCCRARRRAATSSPCPPARGSDVRGSRRVRRGGRRPTGPVTIAGLATRGGPVDGRPGGDGTGRHRLGAARTR